MRRRFNTVVLPLPDSADEEVEIVKLRLDAIGGALELPPATTALEEIRRVVTIFRELRVGRHRGRPHEAQVADRHAVHGRGDQRRHQRARARHPLRRRQAHARGRRGRADRRGRAGPGPGPRRVAGVPRGGRARARRLGRAVPGLPRAVTHTVFGIRHHGPGSARSLERALGELQPDAVLIEGPPEATRCCRWPLRRPSRRSRCSPTSRTSRRGPRSIRSRASRPSGGRSATRRSTTCRCASWTCRRRTRWPTRDDEPRRGLRADPLAALAEVAGHGDPERWWEDVVESRPRGARSRR